LIFLLIVPTNHPIAIKLSYVMSQYYELNGRSATACSFAGNGTVNNAAAPSASASSAASSCIANPTAVFTPSSAPTAGSGGTNTGKTSSTGGTKGSSAIALVGDNNAVVGMSLMAIVSVLGAMFTLA
jgi:hypothetical protein